MTSAVGDLRAVSDPALSRAERVILLFCVAACAACGLIYELVLLTLSVSLIGGGITQTSLIVAGYIAALGAGALIAKPLTRRAAVSFVGVEILLGVFGGLTGAGLYVTFAFAFPLAQTALGVATVVLGMLVGAEVPLLMTLLHDERSSDASGAGKLLANLNAADYSGAVLGGLSWPFLLLPWAGMVRGSAFTGLINLLAAAVVCLLLFRGQWKRRVRAVAALALVLAALVVSLVLVRSADIETTSRQRLYADPIIEHTTSPYQEIVITRRGEDMRLYLDGDLQFSSRDEHRYTEALVFPAVAHNPQRVLVLGGGDGLAVRDLLKVPSMSEIVLVDLDEAVVEFAQSTLADLNERAFDDPRVSRIGADAMTWLREQKSATFDAVIVDLPDPDTPALGRLYSQEFYALVGNVAAPDALMSVQSGSPYSTPTAYWRTISSIRAAGWQVTPYHVFVPSFGDWGFALAQRGSTAPQLALPRGLAAPRFLTDDVLQTADVFAPDRPPLDLAPSTLAEPHIVDDMRLGYQR